MGYDAATLKIIEEAPEAPADDKCPKCGAELTVHRGYVGEAVLVCPDHGIVWEDTADAIRRVY